MPCTDVNSYRRRTYAEIDEMYEAKIPAWRFKSYETSPESKLATIQVGGDANANMGH
jgi:hypothetical protein